MSLELLNHHLPIALQSLGVLHGVVHRQREPRVLAGSGLHQLSVQLGVQHLGALQLFCQLFLPGELSTQALDQQERLLDALLYT